MGRLTSQNLLPNEYLDLLLEPLADVFNQLRHPIQRPLKYNAFKLDECEWGVHIGVLFMAGLAQSFMEEFSHLDYLFMVASFTLLDGTVLYGTLMEYIEGQEFQANVEPALSHERQIKMVPTLRLIVVFELTR
ncbi:hypothetical protein C0992_009162 [Termitomyces sp. T32_za158]|nr:hypothetical protein C0992_009162 [Termitomyces sp. T32_za158]